MTTTPPGTIQLRERSRAFPTPPTNSKHARLDDASVASRTTKNHSNSNSNSNSNSISQASNSDTSADAGTSAKVPVVQARNANALAYANPLPGDAFVTFEEEAHKYTVHGEPVERSTTRVLKDYFEQLQFDPVENTNTYYPRWKRNPLHKYHARIHEVLDGGGTDEQAKATIRADWTALGEAASRLGTLFHLYAEFVENDQLEEVDESKLVEFSEIRREVEQYHRFKRSDFVRVHNIRPLRSELCVFDRDHALGLNVCAGQVDMLYKDDLGLHYLIDWKRTGCHHTLDAGDTAFGGRCGFGPVSHLPDTDYQRYSLQTSAYNIMLLSTHNIDVGDRMYIVRVHDDRPEYELVKCRDLRVEARAMLDEERDRLVDQRLVDSGASDGAEGNPVHRPRSSPPPPPPPPPHSNVVRIS